MPLYELVFTAVGSTAIEADTLEEAEEKGRGYDTSQIDWNVDFDYAEELEDEE